MITCTLREKTYTVDFITGRAIREIGPALDMYGKILEIADKAEKGETVTEMVTIPEAMDVLVKWFCTLFGNQFTPDDVYDNYPSDRILHDLALAIVAVQNNTTSVLSEFPTKAAEAEKKTRTKKS